LSVGGVPGQPGPVSLSPDESTAMIVRMRQLGTGLADLWLYDLSRRSENRFTFENAVWANSNAVWSPDGGRVAFPAAHQAAGDIYTNTDIYMKDLHSAGPAESVIRNDNHKIPTDWSRNDLLLYTQTVPKTGADLWYVHIDGKPNASANPILFLQTE